MTGQNAADLISVPQGGGALSGIGETFQPDLHTGTGNYSIPLAVPPARGGMQPSLALSYSTGNPHGPYGFGWTLAIPQVRRKTDRGLPRYGDSDVFVLSGAEDLVPVPPGPGTTTGQQFRPRVEGLYARIIHHTDGGQDYWEVRSRSGEKSTYGTRRPTDAPAGWRDPAAVSDPADPSRIFAWLLSETDDTCCNRVVYSYSTDGAGNSQLYLTDIQYVDHGDPANPSYLIGIAFTYEARPDPFSDRRASFEIRTTWRCRTIETWLNHQNPPVLSRSVHLEYSQAVGNGASVLSRVTVTGHDGTAIQQLPPLELGYTAWDPSTRRYQQLTSPAASMPAASLASKGLDLVDLFGDGLPAVLQVDGQARYWRNRGATKFDPPRPLTFVPAGVSLAGPGVQLADVDGDGRTDLLVSSPTRTGYWPLSSTGGFDPSGYVAAASAPTFSLSDPDVRLIDLDGDGIIDALRTGDRFELFYNDGRGDFTTLQIAPQPPEATFTDPRIRLADMTGDGLTDIVMLHNGHVSYWPYRGYGRWDPPITMTNPPHFEDGAEYDITGFDPRRLLLGDIDGDGCADLAYVGDGHVTVWINQAGNGFADPIVVAGTPPASDPAQIRLADILGNGTSGILWTYNLGSVRGSNYKFLDLTGGTKPYLLNQIDNHTGAATTITYAPSTAYATADRAAGTAWRTTLPFPVQVVASLTVKDVFSGTELTTEFTYHHGYWDGADREFRGFARVDQRDMRIGSPPGDGLTAAPTETRTWFHPGPVGPKSGAWTEGLDLSGEYWPGDQARLSQTIWDLPAGLPRHTYRDAVRSLRGRVLRTEVYGLDGDLVHETRPYLVTENRYRVRAVLDGQSADPLDPGWAAQPVFVPQTVASRTTRWERGDDPLHQFSWTEGHDAYGRPRLRGDAAVPHGQDPETPTTAASGPYLVTAAALDYATRDDPGGYVTERVAASTQLDVVDTGTLALADLWSTVVDGSATTVLIGHEVTFYDGDAFTGLPLGQLGDQALAVRAERLVHTPASLADAYRSGDTETSPPELPPQLVLPPTGWPADYPAAYQTSVPATAGYLRRNETGGFHDGWYSPVTLKRYGPRGQVLAERDPLGHETSIGYDGFDLLPVTITNPAGLTRTASYDYRVLQPAEVIDVNGNHTQYAYTPLGVPAWVAVMGKPGEEVGDTPGQPGTVYEYGLSAYDDAPSNSPQPIWVHTTRRTDYRWQIVAAERDRRKKAGLPPPSAADIAALFPPGERDQFPDRFIQTREYSDGFGRLLQTRHQAAALTCDDVGLPGAVETPPTDAFVVANPGGATTRTIVSGWQIYDGKGHIVARYEPYFDNGWTYGPPSQTALDNVLACTLTQYDPLGRPVRTIYPDGAREDTILGIPPDLTNPAVYVPTPWQTYSYDRNDNAGRTHPTTSGAWRSHWNTPTSTLVDARSRVTAHTERIDGRELTSHTSYDARGNVLEVTDPLGRVTSRARYDLLDRLWRTELLDSGTARMVLDTTGTVIEERDSRGALLLTTTDALNRPVSRWARADLSAATPLVETFEYGDSAPALTRTQAAAANLLGKAYQLNDGAGRLTYTSYDLLGNPSASTRLVPTLAALVANLPQGGGDWSHHGPPIDWSQGGPPLDPNPFDVTIRCDALGRRVSVTCPVDGSGTRAEITASYDPAGHVTSLSVAGRGYADAALYNARGQRVMVRHGNAALVRYAYDAKTGRLIRARSERYTEPTPLLFRGTGSPQRDVGYAYDLVGNVTRTLDRTPGCGVPPAIRDALDRDFSYDALYRMVTATGRECDIPPPTPPWEIFQRGTDVTKARQYAESYSYDDVGNLRRLVHASGATSPLVTTRAYALVADGNELASMTAGSLTYAYTYDSAGNLIAEADSRHFEYDAARRLVTYRTQVGTAVPSVYAQYLYDATGTRVAALVRTQDGALRMRIWIGEFFERLTLRSATGQVSSYDVVFVADGAIRIGRQRLGPPAPDDQLPDVTIDLTDHLGSVVAEVDSGGITLTREEFTPFGETSFGGYAAKRYRFTGKPRDTETGFSYHGARYYAAYLCRWITCDPAGHADGYTPYAYCRNRPVTLADPTGRQAKPLMPDPFLSPPGAPRPPLRLLPPAEPLPPGAPALGELAVTAAAVLAAVASMILLVVSIDKARKHEETPIEVMDDYYGTHFGDIVGWVKGVYSQRPTAAPVASARNDAKERQQFREWATSQIMNGCNGTEHPLRRVLDAQGKPYNAASKASPDPIWDAGHKLSRKAGGKAMGMEDSSFNREKGFKDERQGVAFEQVFIDICGVPVEKETAKRWESAGIIPKGTVEAAPPSEGWLPPGSAPAMPGTTAVEPQDAKPPVLDNPLTK